MSVQHTGAVVVVGWKRRTLAPLKTLPPADDVQPLTLPPRLQVGRPQHADDMAETGEDATPGEASDIELLMRGRMKPSPVTPAVPPAPVEGLPEFVRRRGSPEPLQRNVTVRDPERRTAIPYDYSVRPSQVDRSLLVDVAGAGPSGKRLPGASSSGPQAAAPVVDVELSPPPPRSAPPPPAVEPPAPLEAIPPPPPSSDTESAAVG